MVTPSVRFAFAAGLPLDSVIGFVTATCCGTDHSGWLQDTLLSLGKNNVLVTKLKDQVDAMVFIVCGNSFQFCFLCSNIDLMALSEYRLATLRFVYTSKLRREPSAMQLDSEISPSRTCLYLCKELLRESCEPIRSKQMRVVVILGIVQKAWVNDGCKMV